MKIIFAEILALIWLDIFGIGTMYLGIKLCKKFRPAASKKNFLICSLIGICTLLFFTSGVIIYLEGVAALIC